MVLGWTGGLGPALLSGLNPHKQREKVLEVNRAFEKGR